MFAGGLQRAARLFAGHRLIEAFLLNVHMCRVVPHGYFFSLYLLLLFFAVAHLRTL